MNSKGVLNLPVLFLSQSIEQLGLQLESWAADFPLICFLKSYGIIEKRSWHLVRS